MIICDANILIGFLDDTDRHSGAVRTMIENHFVEGFGANVLTIAEALVHPAGRGVEERAEASLRRIGMRIFELEATDSARLARVRSRYHIRMPDAVVLHQAMVTGSRVATCDRSLARAASEAGVGVIDLSERV